MNTWSSLSIKKNHNLLSNAKWKAYWSVNLQLKPNKHINYNVWDLLIIGNFNQTETDKTNMTNTINHISIWRVRFSVEKQIYLFKINPRLNLRHLPWANASNPPKDQSGADKHNESGNHSKPNNCSYQVHAWSKHTQRLPLTTSIKNSQKQWNYTSSMISKENPEL